VGIVGPQAATREAEWKLNYVGGRSTGPGLVLFGILHSLAGSPRYELT